MFDRTPEQKQTGKMMQVAKIRNLVDNNKEPTNGELLQLMSSTIDNGSGVLTPYYPGGLIITANASDKATELPNNYPMDLPRPYIDVYGRLVLRAVPIAKELTAGDMGWIMVALQIAINKYGKEPYDINFVMGDSSGYGYIKNVCEGQVIYTYSFILKYHDFLIAPHPDKPDPIGNLVKGLVTGIGAILFPPSALIIGGAQKLAGSDGPITGDVNIPELIGDLVPGDEQQILGQAGNQNPVPVKKNTNIFIYIIAAIALILLIIAIFHALKNKK